MSEEYVLVHGAAHGAWCWEEVTKRLARRGHRVVTLALPGHGRRAAEAARASASSDAGAVADAMAREGVSRGIVVGHSMGGLVISKLAELVPERVAHLVYLAAVVLPDRSSLAETHLPPPSREAVRAMARGRGDGTFLYPAETARARWMSDLPREHPTVQRALALLTPQPLRPFEERLDLSRFYAMKIPRTYIRCLRDAAVTPARAAVYAARLGVRPIHLDAGHDPMLSRPDELVRLLDTIDATRRGTPMDEALKETTRRTARMLFHTVKGGVGFETWKKFDKELARELSLFFTGKLYSREVIPQKQRELCAVASLTVLNRKNELRAHIHAALNVGATRREVGEVIFQQVTYGGMPVVVEALEVFKQVLEERGEWEG